jgi:hypothetical protein
VKQLKDNVYREEQHKKRKKREKDKRLAREAEEGKRSNDPKTSQYHIVNT